MTARERIKREEVRFQAGDLFAEGATDGEVALRLRVTPMSAGRWRRAWVAGGKDALVSKGAGGQPCRLDEDQLAALQEWLDAGPGAHGWEEDQRWTLARVAELIERRFRISYTLRGVGYLLHRIGWSWQSPTRRAAERDEAKIQAWREETWPAIKARRRPRAPGWSSKTRPART
ncbi:MAG: winged helix-turn-helix domain-containing protein [Pseudonocardiaceae bacterium]